MLHFNLAADAASVLNWRPIDHRCSSLQIVEKSFVSETATIAMIYAQPSQQPHIISPTRSSTPTERQTHPIFMIELCTTNSPTLHHQIQERETDFARRIKYS